MRRLGKEIWKNRAIYIILLPGLVWFFVFAYMPMGGLTLAFKEFNASMGIWGSPWVGFENFRDLFHDPAFMESVWRTLAINIGKLIVTFPVPVVLALLFNELRMRRYSKVLQTVFTFPNFLSWVITSGIIINILSNTGLVNGIFQAMGFDAVNFLGSEKMFIPMLYLSEIWKTAGSRKSASTTGGPSWTAASSIFPAPPPGISVCSARARPGYASSRWKATGNPRWSLPTATCWDFSMCR